MIDLPRLTFVFVLLFHCLSVAKKLQCFWKDQDEEFEVTVPLLPGAITNAIFAPDVPGKQQEIEEQNHLFTPENSTKSAVDTRNSSSSPNILRHRKSTREIVEMFNRRLSINSNDTDGTRNVPDADVTMANARKSGTPVPTQGPVELETIFPAALGNKIVSRPTNTVLMPENELTILPNNEPLTEEPDEISDNKQSDNIDSHLDFNEITSTQLHHNRRGNLCGSSPLASDQVNTDNETLQAPDLGDSTIKSDYGQSGDKDSQRQNVIPQEYSQQDLVHLKEDSQLKDSNEMIVPDEHEQLENDNMDISAWQNEYNMAIEEVHNNLAQQNDTITVIDCKVALSRIVRV